MPLAAPGETLRPEAQEEVDLLGRDAAHRFLARDEPLLRERDGDAHGRLGRALGVARLQHPQASALDGEFHVLHVAVVALEPPAGRGELPPDPRHLRRERRDGLRRARAGHHVLALRVREPVALDLRLAGGHVARGDHARARAGAEVAEHHRLDVHGGAQVVRDAGGVAVVDRALAVPRAEDGRDGLAQLHERILRKIPPRPLADDRAELGRDRLQVGRGEVRVVGDAPTLAQAREHRLERLVGNAHHDGGEHLHEAPVGVGHEALVARRLREPLGHGVVEPDVEHRVHHAGHRELRAGAARDEERALRIAELAAGLPFDLRERGEDLLPHPPGESSRREEGIARLRADDEARGHRKAEPRHLREVRALAAEEVALRGAAFPEQVDPLVGPSDGRLLPRGCWHGAPFDRARPPPAGTGDARLRLPWCARPRPRV